MFSFGHRKDRGGARLRALRDLYRDYFAENGPEARGRRLLRQWLTPEQLAQFDAAGHFDVIGSQTGTRYRIHYGTASNVQEIGQAGEPRMGWCFVPKGAVVAGDIMLAQKIALETDELTVLSIANRFTPSALPPAPRQPVRRPY
jgi:hypothetical protein